MEKGLGINFGSFFSLGVRATFWVVTQGPPACRAPESGNGGAFSGIYLFTSVIWKDQALLIKALLDPKHKQIPYLLVSLLRVILTPDLQTKMLLQK